MSNRLPDLPDVRDLLQKHGLRPKRSFSQNFLVQPQATARIADAAVALGHTVVELGPGLGGLTHALLARGCRVLAVELDRDMVEVLRAELGQHPNLQILEGDAANFDLTSYSNACAEKLVVTGNLPYQSTGAIIRQVVHHRAALAGAVLMVQREVRDRLVGAPGTKDYGALTVFVQAAFEVDTICRLRPGSFYPPPKVESAVVRLRPREKPRAEENDTFRAVVHAAFRARRKTLRNALRVLADPERVARAAAEAGIDLGRRGEALSVEELASLAACLDAHR